AGIGGEANGLFGSLTPVVPAAAVTPSSLDFGSERIGSSTASRTPTLFSTGAIDLSVSGVDIVGLNKADFKIMSDGCSRTAVPPRTSCAVTVRFRPSAAGPRKATLRFLDD